MLQLEGAEGIPRNTILLRGCRSTCGAIWQHTQMVVGPLIQTSRTSVSFHVSDAFSQISGGKEYELSSYLTTLEESKGLKVE